MADDNGEKGAVQLHGRFRTIQSAAEAAQAALRDGEHNEVARALDQIRREAEQGVANSESAADEVLSEMKRAIQGMDTDDEKENE